MRIFTYRNKRLLRHILWTALGVFLLIATLVICRFIFLQRYVVYTDEGVRLDYTQKIRPDDAQPAPADPALYPFETIVDVSGNSEDNKTLKQFSGYYITTTMLGKHLDEVLDALDELDDYDAIMIDVKSIFGYYYYSSEQKGAQTADADIAAIDALIAELTAKKNLTVIAHVPAFSDPLFAFDNQSAALPLYTGALWMDENRCYWLNPYSSTTQAFLSSIALELNELGFDEVVFDEFYFPDSDRIAWNAKITRQEAIVDAARNIVDNLYGMQIHISFGSSAPELMSYAKRLYVRTDDATQVMTLTDSMSDVMTDPASQLVFVTTSHDTRFAQCSVLQPLLVS